METFAFRLLPGNDLRKGIQQIVDTLDIRAGWILTCAGSLTQLSLRLANAETSSVWQGHFEIVSLTGTLSISGSHLHMAVADKEGRVTGGHLLNDNLIYTTAEIVIGFRRDLEFTRVEDGRTGWKELTIRNI